MSKAPPRAAEQTSHRFWFWFLAVLNLLAIVWVLWDEVDTRRPWKDYQAAFNELLVARGKPAEPIHIAQVANPDIGVVDRCHSCHLGIDRPGFEGDDVPLVYRTHPRRRTLLGANHPVDRFGCTICHQGQGAQIKGIASYEFDHGRNDPYWDEPMIGAPFTESSCVACHQSENRIPGADTFNRGRELFARLRCGGCHDTPLLVPDMPAAPRLDHIKAKTSAQFVTEWLQNPGAARPDAVMASFWPEPSPQQLAADPRAGDTWKEQRDREIAALVAFLGSIEPRTPFPEVAIDIDGSDESIARGRKTFSTVGCRACHALSDGSEVPASEGDDEAGDDEAGDDEAGDDEAGDDEAGDDEAGDDPADEDSAAPTEAASGATWQARFGPDLSSIGERATARWLTAWLSDPHAIFPRTRMPKLQLSAEQISDLVSYLVTQRRPGVPPATAEWPDESDPELVAEGKKLVLRYGCYGCHSIAGIEEGAKVGPELTGFGSKTVDLITWGDAKVDCELPELACWTMTKLRHPRWVSGQNLDLLMPDLRLSEQDATALAVFLLGHRVKRVPLSYHHTPSERSRAIDQGEAVIARFNCRGCHEIGRTELHILDEEGALDEVLYLPYGGEVRRFYSQSFDAPPPLTFAGEKFQFSWLFDFLSEPFPVRPWLQIRMPKFGLSDAQKDALIRYFAAMGEQPFPFSNDQAAPLSSSERPAAQQLFRDLQCFRCHRISGATGLAAGELAPDLSLVARRLKASWVKQWLLSPQHLQPGTKMPTYFPLEDDDDPQGPRSTPCPECFAGDVAKQIEMLTRVCWELGAGIDLGGEGAEGQ